MLRLVGFARPGPGVLPPATGVELRRPVVLLVLVRAGAAALVLLPAAAAAGFA